MSYTFEELRNFAIAHEDSRVQAIWEIIDDQLDDYVILENRFQSLKEKLETILEEA